MHIPATQVTDTPPASESENLTKNVPGWNCIRTFWASILSINPSIKLKNENGHYKIIAVTGLCNTYLI